MRDYTKYDIWKGGIEISIKKYKLTKPFPEEEKFGIVSQLRRASVSISSNFVEGCSISSEKEFKRFIEIALGSVFELKTQLIISNKLGFTEERLLTELTEMIDKTSKQLNALRNKLK
ncbi:four helix bundle protein [Ekhidna sp.]